MHQLVEPFIGFRPLPRVVQHEVPTWVVGDRQGRLVEDKLTRVRMAHGFDRLQMWTDIVTFP